MAHTGMSYSVSSSRYSTGTDCDGDEMCFSASRPFIFYYDLCCNEVASDPVPMPDGSVYGKFNSKMVRVGDELYQFGT